MTQQLGQQGMGLPHTRPPRPLRHRDPHRQRVDERAHHPVGALAALHASEQHRAEDHILASRDLASTCAQARWQRLAALTPSLRACVPQTPRQIGIERQIGLPRSPLPSPCTSSSPKGAVGSSTSPSISPEEGFVLLSAHPQPGLRHQVAERQRRGQLVAPVPADAPASPPASPPASCGRPPDDAAAASSASGPVLRRRRHRPAAAAPGAHRSGSCRGSKRAYNCSATSPAAGSSSTSSTGSGALRQHHLHRLRQALPTPPPCAECRAGRSPPAWHRR